jgi:hypothetical protein
MQPLPRMLQDFPLGEIQNPAIVKSFPAEGLREFRVNAHTLGSLMICFDAIDEARVIAAGEAALLPQRIKREGSTLLIEGPSLLDSVQNSQNEKLLIEVHVPTHTHVDVQMSTGVVILNGGDGNVNIHGQLGEISGITNSRKVKAHLRAGDVTLYELHGTADIDVAAGSVTLKWSALDGSERINVRTALGGIDLYFPPGLFPAEHFDGLFKSKTVRTAQGTSIYAQINFGGLDIREWVSETATELPHPLPL